MTSPSPHRRQCWLDRRRPVISSPNRRGGEGGPGRSEYLLDEMGRLDACLFRVVDGNLGRLLRTLADILAGILRGALGKVEGLFAAIRGLHRDGFCSSIHVGDGAMGCL